MTIIFKPYQMAPIPYIHISAPPGPDTEFEEWVSDLHPGAVAVWHPENEFWLISAPGFPDVLSEQLELVYGPGANPATMDRAWFTPPDGRFTPYVLPEQFAAGWTKPAAPWTPPTQYMEGS